VVLLAYFHELVRPDQVFSMAKSLIEKCSKENSKIEETNSRISALLKYVEEIINQDFNIFSVERFLNDYIFYERLASPELKEKLRSIKELVERRVSEKQIK